MDHSMMTRLGIVVCVVALLPLSGCSGPTNDPRPVQPGESAVDETVAADTPDAATPEAAAPDAAAPEMPAPESTAAAEVEAAKNLLDGLGANAKYKAASDGRLTQIIIQDGSSLSANDIALFGKLPDLKPCKSSISAI